MPQISKYQVVSILFSGPRNTVYLTKYEDEFFILKCVSSNRPDFALSVLRLEKEYRIAKKLEGKSGFLTPIEFITDDEYSGIVWKENGLITLKKYLKKHGPIDPASFLEWAETLARSLHELHSVGVIHRDISNKNILIHEETKKIYLIDFDTSSYWKEYVENFLAVERGQPTCGTHQYMSPEHTGKIQRQIDFRSDIYALGIIFHELLLGTTPFSQVTNAHTLLYAQAAVKIPPIHHYKEVAVPIVIGHIVAKMLEKIPEKRYQSMYGLLMDLKSCRDYIHLVISPIGRRLSLEMFRKRPDCITVEESMTKELEHVNLIQSKAVEIKPEICPIHLGESDKSSYLQAVYTLYGRESEISQILHHWNRSTKESVALFVTGFSGQGKSSLISECLRRMRKEGTPENSIKSHEHRKEFLSAKGEFQQYNKVPYDGLVRMFQDMLQNTIAEFSVEQVRDVLKKLKEEDIRILSDFIPEIVPLLELTEIPRVETNGELYQRMTKSLTKFINLLASLYQQSRVVIFLDDIQRADSNSIIMIQQLFHCPDVNIFALLAFREGEADLSMIDPLLRPRKDFQHGDFTRCMIRLGPLLEEDVQNIIREMLGNSHSHSIPRLSRVVSQKTQGNPFFVIQIMSSLYSKGLLVFDFENQEWSADISGCKELPHTNNVVEMLLAEAVHMDENTRAVLTAGACIGSSFDIQLVSSILGQRLDETLRYAALGLQTGMIQPLDSKKHSSIRDGDTSRASSRWEGSSSDTSDTSMGSVPLGLITSRTFKFLHDKVHESFYSFYTEEEKRPIHYRLGKILLEKHKSSLGDDSAMLFTIVRHLNMSESLMSCEKDILELVKLNQKASDRTITGGGYAKSAEYATKGLELLSRISSDPWSEHYSKTMKLKSSLARAYFLNGQIPNARIHCSEALEKSMSNQERANIIKIQAAIEVSLQNYHKAKLMQLDILSLFGVEFDHSLEGFFEKMKQIETLLNGRTYYEAFSTLPLDHSPDLKLIYSTLIDLIPTGFISRDFSLSCNVAAMSVILSFTRGYAPGATALISWLGYSEIAFIKPSARAGNLGRVCAALTEPHKIPRATCYAFFHWGMVTIFGTDQAEMVRAYERGLLSAAETDDFNDYGHVATIFTMSMMEFNCPIPQIFPHLLKQTKFLLRHGLNHFVAAYQPLFDLVQLLMYGRITPINQVPRYSQEQILAFGILGPWNSFWLDYVRMYYLFPNHTKLSESLDQLEIAIPDSLGTSPYFEFQFWYPLALARLKSSDPAKLEKARQCLETLQSYMEVKPENFIHKLELARLEMDLHLGKVSLSGKGISNILLRYDLVIESAMEQHFHCIAGIAAENAFNLLVHHQMRYAAREYGSIACKAYSLWGATAKVSEIRATMASTSFKCGSSSSVSGLSQNFIVENPSDSILQFTNQILSSGNNYLAKAEVICKIMIQHAGANRGFMFHHWAEQNELYLMARWEPDFPLKIFSLPEECALSPNEPTRKAVRGSTVRELIPFSLLEQFVRRTIRYEYLLDQINQSHKSVCCVPMMNAGNLVGVVYLENTLVNSAFNPQSQVMLKHLSNQMAMCFEREILTFQLKHTLKNVKHQNKELHRLRSIKQDFLSKVSTELQYPLHNVLNLVGLFRDTLHGNCQLHSETAQQLSLIQTAAQGLGNVINDLIDIQKDSFQVNITGFDFRLAVDEVMQLSLTNLKPNVSLLTDIRVSDDIVVYGDSVLCQQLILKVLENAMKFTSSGTVIARFWLLSLPPLATEGAELPVDVALSHWEIEDTGIGISPEKVGGLFSAFSQVDSSTTRQYQGTGLGLTLALKILRTITGKSDSVIQVQSELGKGSNFIFDIPFSGTLIKSPLDCSRLEGMEFLVFTDSSYVLDSYRSELSAITNSSLIHVSSVEELFRFLEVSNPKRTVICVDLGVFLLKYGESNSLAWENDLTELLQQIYARFLDAFIVITCKKILRNQVFEKISPYSFPHCCIVSQPFYKHVLVNNINTVIGK